ncbi:hypothetical protein HRbin09_00639 [bacterium HR09]|nr:hypothetical protein HRbin09_00639 [bacterium HR09]
MFRGKTFLLGLVVAVALAQPTLAGFAGTDIYLPSVGSAVGVAPWYTTVWVYNPTSSPANVTFYFLKRQANPSPSSYTDTIPPGDVKRYDDAVQFMFHESNFGALRIVSNQKVLVSSRIYAQSSGEGLRDSKGQYFGGVPASFAIGAGEKTRILGVRQSSSDRSASDFRFNVGVVETTGNSCTVTLRLVDETGAVVGSPRTWNLGAREQKQDNVWSLFGTSMPNHQVEIEVTGGSGKVIAFGSSIANGSDDPSTVEMHFADSLLAENSGGGSGTITGVTAGQGLTGGGTSGNVTLAVANGGITSGMLADNSVTSAKIADGSVQAGDLANGAVTKAKLAASGGGTSGQVLGTDGTNLVWQAAGSGGFTLPYAGSGSASGDLFSITNSGTGTAIYGKSTQNDGVRGEASVVGKSGVYGYNAAAGYGVKGTSISGHGVAGVSGGNTMSGVYGEQTNSGGYAVFGSNTGSGNWGYLGGNEGAKGVGANNKTGVLGSSTSGYGVEGSSSSGRGVFGHSTGAEGVYGQTSAANKAGVYGNNDSANGYGVRGDSASGDGVYGSSSGGNRSGVYGQNSNSFGWGVYGRNTSGGTEGFLGGGLYGVYGKASSNASSKAGWFDGNVHVNGALSKSSGSFKIDHPLDPEHKYLYHSFVESPDMMNIYNGNVVTDEEGRAVVELPEWFEALNKDFRYQLTVIGRFAQAIVEEKIHDNRFVIRTNMARVEVSWQVTGIRKDPWAEAHRIPVEEVKPPEEQGTYLNPKEWGQPEEKGLDYRTLTQLRENSEAMTQTASGSQEHRP